jgi:hypothetical protein
VAELAALTSSLEQAAGPGGTVLISAVNGTAGIGKTALAVHWAHQVACRLPDGQLYVNLRGFDPAGPPMPPAEAVRAFLDAFGVPPERIPVDLIAQASLYRSILAGRRVPAPRLAADGRPARRHSTRGVPTNSARCRGADSVSHYRYGSSDF